MTLKHGISGAAAAALTVVLLLLTAAPGRAELRVDINRGKIEPMPIAIPPFSGGGEAGQVGAEMAAVAADLESSLCPGRRRPQLHPERLDRRGAALCRLAADQPGAGDRHGAAAARRLAAGRVPAVTSLPSSSLPASPILPPGRTGAASRMSSPTRSTSGSPARTAISITARLIAVGPVQSGSSGLPSYQDGANHQYLTDGGIVLTSRFSPSAQRITYLSYAGGAPRVYVQRRYRRQELLNFDDLRAALPDGSKLR